MRRVSIYSISEGGAEITSWLSDKTAIDKLSQGDAVIIFTPDSKLRRI